MLKGVATHPRVSGMAAWRASTLQDGGDPNPWRRGCTPTSPEPESLVGERTSISNSTKSALIRLGTRGFMFELLKASRLLREGHVRAHGGDILSSCRCRRSRFCCPSQVCPIKPVSLLAVAMSAAGLHTGAGIWSVASTGFPC